MTVFNQLPPDPKLAARVVQEEFDDARRAREMGKIGLWFGDRRHAPTYIAGILAGLLLLCMVAVIFAPLGAGADRSDVLKLFGGFFLGTLGYLFGSLSGGAK